MKGTIKFYNQKKGFGFITTENGEDIFFHYTQLPKGKLPTQGQRAEFTIQDTKKGVQANNIILE